MRALVVDASIGSTAFYSRRPSFIACSREGASSAMEGQILALLDRPAQQPGFLFLLMSSARSTVMKRSSIARQITGNTGDINVRSWQILLQKSAARALRNNRIQEARRLNHSCATH